MSQYCETLLAFQQRARVDTGKSDLVLPFAVMTSGDTHDKTVALLEANNNFGLATDQITLMKQEKVPSILDNSAKFATDSPFQVSTKPHGHGDVHSLLYSSGLVSQWAKEGRKWICFFQDTNGLVMRAIPAALGVSKKHDFYVNSLTVPRKAGEAVGGICLLESVQDPSQSLTVNVEYNQLDPLLRANGSPDGDVAGEDGFSPYPGNLNVLVFKCEVC